MANPSNFSWIDYADKTTEEFYHFELEMKDKGYGREECLNAFYFFRAGWNAYRTSEPMYKEVVSG